MMPDHLIDNEPQKFLRKLWVEIGIRRQLAQPRDLFFLTSRIGGRQSSRRLVTSHRLRDLEPLGQHEHQSGIDIVDAFAVSAQHLVAHVVRPLASVSLGKH